jgi:hypothetical protein
MHGGSQSNRNEWRVAYCKQPTNRKTQTLRIQGKYKLVIGSSDDGTRANVTTSQEEICGNRANCVLVSQQATDVNYAFKSQNRRLLSHNHHGGITFTMETPQEEARCINLGIYLNGRKQRILVSTRLQADDLCTNCSIWGHQERNWTASAQCGICSNGYQTDRHPNICNGTNKFRCPNCSTNHKVHHSSCLVRAGAVQKQERVKGNVVPREGGPSQVKSERAEKDKKMEKNHGAP